MKKVLTLTISWLAVINSAIRRKIKPYLASGLLVFAAISLSAQEVVSTGGDYHEAGGKSIQYTIGEIATETLQSTDITLTQGLNQATLEIATKNHTVLSDLTLKVYPNPVSNFLKLESRNQQEELHWKLHDTKGRLLKQESFTISSQIDFTKYPQGTYILSVTNGDKQKQSFQIIKN